jgi:N-acetylglucosaminyl-diphospho-decaprenol L-rhamnosyltransferase
MPFDVTVIVVNYNTERLFERFFDALNASKGSLHVQTIVVDNASTDTSLDALREFHPEVQLLASPHNVGFGRANNQALPHVRGRYVLLLNTDAFVSPETLSLTVEFMDANPGCGVLGVKLVGEDGALQPSCRYFPTPWNVFLASTGLGRFFPRSRMVDDMAWDHSAVRECDWVPGCYYLIRREVIDTVGLFDPRYFLYGEEVDHCRAVRNAGWSVVYYPHTRVVHLGGESALSAGALSAQGRQLSPLQIESELLYFRKHHGLAGVLAAAALTTLGDCMRAGSGLLRHRDSSRATDALRHARMTLDRLMATRFASRPTR